PRVARNELPWVFVHQTSPTATRLRPTFRSGSHDGGHNPVGVVFISGHSPKVGVARQSWAGSHNPFGIARSAAVAKPSRSTAKCMRRRGISDRLLPCPPAATGPADTVALRLPSCLRTLAASTAKFCSGGFSATQPGNLYKLPIHP